MFDEQIDPDIHGECALEIVRLNREVTRLQAIADAPRGTDAQILKERELTAAAGMGAIAFGGMGHAAPPYDALWLAPFWEIGMELRGLRARCEAAEQCMVMLTADHNTGPHYVKGFDMAGEHFAKYPTGA